MPTPSPEAADTGVETVINGRLIVRLTARDDYLAVESRGEADLEDFYLGIDYAAIVAMRDGHTRVLFDLRATRQSMPFSSHLLLGQQVAKSFDFAERVASVVPQEYRTGSSEKAAQKSGLNLRAFVNLDEAVRWLNEP
jgi:hypothetical protein